MPTLSGRLARPVLPLAALLLAALMLAAPVRAQVCEGNITLTSQAQVNAFACTSVTGNLNISGSDIVTLIPLSELTSVGGDLAISFNAALASLDGLSALTSVGGNLSIGFTAALASLDGLSALTSVGGSLQLILNLALASLDGLSGVTSVGGNLDIWENPALASLDGLSALTSVGGNIRLDDNRALASLDGLSALTSVGGNLFILFNAALASLDGLSALTSVGGFLSIVGNNVLASLHGLSALTSVGLALTIQVNPALPSLDGLSALISVGENLVIQENAALSTCSCGLAGLVSGDPPAFSGVASGVYISGNDAGGTCTSPGVVLANPCATTEPPVNTPPVADAGPDQTVIAGQSVTLDGSASYDDDGDALTYAWTLDGSSSPTLSDASAVSPTFCAASADIYTASLVVNDGTEDSVSDTVTITAITASAALDALLANVEALRAAGVLSDGQARGLSRNLTQAKTLLARGKTDEALAALAGFRQQALDLWEKDGVLTEEQAMALVASVDAIIAALAAPCSTEAEAPEAFARIDAGVPTSFALAAAYPNPLRSSATLSFDVAEASDVRVVVYDVQGREVAVLAEGRFEAARHAVFFDGSALPNGLYLVRMSTAGGFSQTQRLTVLR
jgi:hypothetical protein